MVSSYVIWLALSFSIFKGTMMILNATRVSVIGSGNWGSVIARNLARTALTENSRISKEVNMWVHDEFVEGRSIVDIINEDHENIKYLPNVALPTNLVAVRDVVQACSNADLLVFVLPHQFLSGILEQLRGKVKRTAIGVSLIKSIHFTADGPQRCTELIQRGLNLQHTAAIMGANIASDVAADEYVETTVASEDPHTAQLVADIFRTPHLHTEVSTDLATVEFCGALKNIVAVGAGICDGVGASASSKAALMRQGLREMATFCQEFSPVPSTFTLDTMLLSCGVADLIVTCSSGRNSKCGREYVRRLLQAHQHEGTSRGTTKKTSTGTSDVSTSDASAQQSGEVRRGGAVKEGTTTATVWQGTVANIWSAVEHDICCGQKLQGVSTLKEVMQCLGRKYGDTGTVYAKYPLFCRIYEIAGQGLMPGNLFVWR